MYVIFTLLAQWLLTRSQRFDLTTPDVESTIFRSYAIRVKDIVHCHRVLTEPECIPTNLFNQLINLESARIESRASGTVPLRMSLAPRLRALALQIGYTKSNSTSTTVHDMVSLLKGRSSLEQLSVRGHSSECLHVPLSNIVTLRSLSLHLSSLTEQSFMTVSTFPLLADFDVHADRLPHDHLATAFAHASGAPFFPALEKLKIRAQPTLVALVLQQLPHDKLRSLHIDATGPGMSSAFDSLFKAMTNLPLHELTLEHATSVDESEDIPAYTPDRFFTLDHLQPLSKLPLRSFILDTSLPPDLSDAAIEEMTTWWPLLRHLQLGACTALENVETDWTPRTSLASLFALARRCRHLKHLVITLDANVGSLSLPNPLASHPLTSLSIGSRCRPDVAFLSAMLPRLFPSLVDLTLGFVGEHENAWNVLQVAVRNLPLGSS